jgi:hypothetical protein
MKLRDEYGLTGLGFGCMIGSVLFSVIAFVISLAWISSEKQAQVINKEYGTHYTTSEIFWTGDTITKVIVGNKNRIELTK